MYKKKIQYAHLYCKKSNGVVYLYRVNSESNTQIIQKDDKCLQCKGIRGIYRVQTIQRIFSLPVWVEVKCSVHIKRPRKLRKQYTTIINNEIKRKFSYKNIVLKLQIRRKSYYNYYHYMRRNYFLAMILIGSGMIQTVDDRNLIVDGNQQTIAVVVRNQYYQTMHFVSEEYFVMLLQLMKSCDVVESMRPRRGFYKHLKNTLIFQS